MEVAYGLGSFWKSLCLLTTDCLLNFLQRLQHSIFASIYSRGMHRYEDFIAQRKQKLFEGIHGHVLEIGPGPGGNFRFFSDVKSWVGVEPNQAMISILEQNLESSRLTGEIQQQSASHLTWPENHFDFVVGTLVLCSVDRPESVLKEVKRVLKPGGRYLFIEHVRDPSWKLRQRVQRFLRFGWKITAAGCRTDLDSYKLIGENGFSEVDAEQFEASSWVIPWFLTPHISGIATK